jgi:hypothetical protein
MGTGRGGDGLGRGAGVVWTLQGAGLIRGSSMTGVRLWMLVGPIVAVGGLAVVTTALRRR